MLSRTFVDGNARAEDAMLWVPGSILGDAGHAWGPMDPPIHLIDVGPAPGHQPSIPWLGLVIGAPPTVPLGLPPTVCTVYDSYRSLEYLHVSKSV